MGDHGGQLLLVAAIDEAFERKSWHGPNLLGSLRGVTAEAALWRRAAHDLYHAGQIQLLKRLQKGAL